MINKTIILVVLFVVMPFLHAADVLDFSDGQRSTSLQLLVHEANLGKDSSFKITTWESRIEQFANFESLDKWSSKERRQLLYVLGLLPAPLFPKNPLLGKTLAGGVNLSDTIELRLLFDLLKANKVEGLEAPRIYLAMLKDPFLANVRSRYFKHFSSHQSAVEAYVEHCLQIGLSNWTDEDFVNLSSIKLPSSIFDHVMGELGPLMNRRETPEMVNKAVHMLILSEQIVRFDDEWLKRFVESDNVVLLNLGYALILFDDRFEEYRNRAYYMEYIKRAPPHAFTRRMAIPPYTILGLMYVPGLTDDDYASLMKYADPLIRICCVLSIWRQAPDIQIVMRRLQMKEDRLRLLSRQFGIASMLFDKKYAPPERKRDLKRSLQVAIHELTANHQTPGEKTNAVITLMETLSVRDRDSLLQELDLSDESFLQNAKMESHLLGALEQGSAAALEELESLLVDEEKILAALRVALSSDLDLPSEDSLLCGLLKRDVSKQSLDLLELRANRLAWPSPVYLWLREALMKKNDVEGGVPPLKLHKTAFRTDFVKHMGIVYGLRASLTAYANQLQSKEALFLWNNRRSVRDVLRLLSFDSPK